MRKLILSLAMLGSLAATGAPASAMPAAQPATAMALLGYESLLQTVQYGGYERRREFLRRQEFRRRQAIRRQEFRRRQAIRRGYYNRY